MGAHCALAHQAIHPFKSAIGTGDKLCNNVENKVEENNASHFHVEYSV